MELAQGQVHELLRLAIQHDSILSNVVPKLLENKRNEIYVVSYIQKGLATFADHDGALKLLSNVVCNFSNDAICDHLTAFIETVWAHKKESNMKFQFFENALKSVRYNEHVRKTPLLLLIPKIVEKCIAVDRHSAHEVASLSCLATCLEFYSSTCGQLTRQVETHLVRYLNYDRAGSVVSKAARCFHYLQQCGPPGNCSMNHVQNWTSAFNRVCLTIKELLKCLDDANYTFRHDAAGDMLFPLDMDSCATGRFSTAEHKLLNLLEYLSALIELKFPCEKVMKPQIVIDLLKSCGNTHQTSSGNTIEAFCLGTVQTEVEIQLFYVFRSFVALMKLSLMPFSSEIMKTLTDKLQETRGNQLKHNSRYKKGLYRLISYFVEMMKNNIHQFRERLLDSILDDVIPVTENVTLSAPNTVNRSVNDKQRNNRASNADIGGNNMITREEICCAALDCLKKCFQNMQLNIKYNKLKHTYQSLCKTLLSVQNGKTTPPYLTSRSTCKLYEVIVASLDQIHPPHVQTVVKLLLAGQSNGNGGISSVCSAGLMSIEKICQPTRPLVFSTVSAQNFISGVSVVTEENGEVMNNLSDSVTIKSSDSWSDSIIEDEEPREEVLQVVVIEHIDEDAVGLDLGENVVQINQDTIVLPLAEESYVPPSKVSRQAEAPMDNVTLADMLKSFIDVQTQKKNCSQ